MNFLETLELALSAIWAHKLRSILTLLGMIIGVTAVVIVVSIIQGFNKYVDEKIAGIGTKSFSVRRFSFDDWKNIESSLKAQRRNKELTIDDFEYVRERAVMLDQFGYKASPQPARIKYEDEMIDTVRVDGATANTADIENIEISDGRFFSSVENEIGSNVAVIGADIADKLFATADPIEKEISIDGLPYRIIGVAAAKGAIFGIPQDLFITVPFGSFVKQFGPPVRNRGFYMIGTAKDFDRFTDTVEEVRALIRSKRGLKSGEKDNFGIMTPDAIMGIRDQLLGPIFIAAIGVPGIALIVGGIVIMNIMLVSVTERTKEIGIRKSLGARQKDILLQFLIEAITLAIIGGIIGVILAAFAGYIVSALYFPTYLSWGAVVIAILFSGTVGVLAGILPARKAAMMNPIDALRFE